MKTLINEEMQVVSGAYTELTVTDTSDPIFIRVPGMGEIVIIPEKVNLYGATGPSMPH